MTAILRGLAWMRDSIANQAQRFLLNVLAAGPVPKHVAFVMDGNRRYARRQQKQVAEGHADGFVALRRVSVPCFFTEEPRLTRREQMLEVCLRLNIQCVSAYAFSIENFKRSEDEVEALMKLAEEKLLELCEHGCVLHPAFLLFRCLMVCRPTTGTFLMNTVSDSMYWVERASSQRKSNSQFKRRNL